MKKMYWKNALVPLLLMVSLPVIVGCQQTAIKPVSAISDAPPGTDANDENRIVASMGAINLSNKQVISYLLSMDPQVLTRALNQDSGLENLVKGVALRTNVITRAAGQNWLERAEVQAKIEDAQRIVLYGMYMNEKNKPPADYPDDAAVTQVYEASNQQLVAAGKPALKPLKEIAPVIRQRLRERQQQLNEQNYLNGLVSSNPITVDLDKLFQFINLSLEQKQQQQERLKESVARVGNMGVTMGLALKSLRNLEPAQQQQLLNNTQQLQQYLSRLALQYFVLNEAIAEKFNARPVVNNRMEQARMQTIYTTYMKAWAAPESDFPGVALIEENYRNNLQNLVVQDRYHFAKIVIANSADASVDEINARQIADMARAGNADFAALARQYSQEPQSANNGGDVGWLNGQALPPEISQLTRGNQPGAVIGPVQYDWGWQIIKILDYQPARQQTLDEARPALVAALRKKRMAEKEKEILEQLVVSEPVTIDNNALQQVRQQISG